MAIVGTAGHRVCAISSKETCQSRVPAASVFGMNTRIGARTPPIWKGPLQGTYRGRALWGLSPESQAKASPSDAEFFAYKGTEVVPSESLMMTRVTLACLAENRVVKGRS